MWFFGSLSQKKVCQEHNLHVLHCPTTKIWRNCLLVMLICCFFFLWLRNAKTFISWMYAVQACSSRVKVIKYLQYLLTVQRSHHLISSQNPLILDAILELQMHVWDIWMDKCGMCLFARTPKSTQKRLAWLSNHWISFDNESFVLSINNGHRGMIHKCSIAHKPIATCGLTPRTKWKVHLL